MTKLPPSSALAGLAALVLLGSAASASGQVLLSDYYTNDGSNSDLNHDLAYPGRQGGTLANIGYTSLVSDSSSEALTSSGLLLLRSGGAAYLNYNFATVNAPISISFDGSIGAGPDSTLSDWLGLEIQNTAGAAAAVNTAAFGVIFRGNGGTQTYDLGAATVGGTGYSSGYFFTTNHYEVVLSDAAGTGAAFGPGGSTISYYENGVLLGTVTDTHLTGGYIGLSASSTGIIDNVVIQANGAAPEASSVAIASLAGGLFLIRRRRK